MSPPYPFPLTIRPAWTLGGPSEVVWTQDDLTAAILAGIAASPVYEVLVTQGDLKAMTPATERNNLMACTCGPDNGCQPLKPGCWGYETPIKKIPEYVTPHFVFVSADLGDRDNDMFAVPRWVLAVLAEELTINSDCGGDHDEPGCARCDAIRVAKEAGDHAAPPVTTPGRLGAPDGGEGAVDAGKPLWGFREVAAWGY